MSKRVQTVEATGKVWKATQLAGLSWIILMATLAMIFAGLIEEAGDSMQTASAVCVFFCLLGFPVWFAGRIGAWWFHG